MKRKLIPILTLTLSFTLPLVATASDGAELWAKNCKKCHGDTGKGDTAMGKKLGLKDYTDAAVQAGFTDEEIAAAIKDGITNEAGKKVMLAFGEKLSEEDVTALVAHLRSLKSE